MTGHEPHVWDGQWASDHLGITVDPALRAHVGVALRRNPRRAHLLVSHHLGKHIPQDPRLVYRRGRLLGSEVRSALHRAGAADPLVIGFAETATGLGAAVADELDSPYLHSTRRAGPAPYLRFEEEHSHATGHLLLPDRADLLDDGRPVVLVDDELSTGRTVRNTIRALHERSPRDTYVVAALVDVRSDKDRAHMRASADELGIRVITVSGEAGRVFLPDDLATRAVDVLAAAPPQAPASSPPRAKVLLTDPAWPAGVREGGRHGYRSTDREAARAAGRQVAAFLAGLVEGERVLVLGHEELMHAPTVIATALADRLSAEQQVRLSSTTSSPALALDVPGYPIRTALTFPASDDPADRRGPRYAYNVAPAAGHEPFTDIVLIVDDVADTPALHGPDGLVSQLAGVCDRVLVHVLPSSRP